MLTYERASELLRYDPDTGKIYWKAKPSKSAPINVGDEAGTFLRIRRNTYRQIRIDGQAYYAHRIAWLLHFGTWPANGIDHLNGVGTDNRPCNLREATTQENRKNQRMQRNNTSGVTGVYWDKSAGKWKAQIGIDGKNKSLGYFTDIDEAAEAYRKAANELGFTERHGEVE